MYTDRIHINTIGWDAHGEMRELSRASFVDARRTALDLRLSGFTPAHVVRCGNLVSVVFTQDPNRAACTRCLGIGFVPTSSFRQNGECFACKGVITPAATNGTTSLPLEKVGAS